MQVRAELIETAMVTPMLWVVGELAGFHPLYTVGLWFCGRMMGEAIERM